MKGTTLISSAGFRMLVDAADSLGLGRGAYESETGRLLRQRVRPGHTAVDLGAGLGYFTLLLSRSVGPRGRVIAFEADPRNADLVRANVRLNGCENVEVVHQAISNREGTIRLYRAPDNRGMNRIYPSIYAGKEAPLEIEAVTLDRYVERHLERVDFIKMDIEGAEALALEGMQATLARNRDIGLLTEFAPGSMMECGSDPVEFIRRLVAQGFSLYGVRTAEGFGRFFRPRLRRYDAHRLLGEVQSFVEALRQLIAEYEEGKRVFQPAGCAPRALHDIISAEMRRKGISLPVIQNLLCLRSDRRQAH